jgi:hypothetical protein
MNGYGDQLQVSFSLYVQIPGKLSGAKTKLALESRINKSIPIIPQYVDDLFYNF